MVTMLVIIIAALLLTAFFSGMEVAFLASNKLKMGIERKTNQSFDRVAGAFLRHPAHALDSLRAAKYIVLVLYSLQAAALIRLLMFRAGLVSHIGLETLVAGTLILFTGEYLPRAIFKRNPNFYFRLFALPAWFFYRLLYPAVAFTRWLARNILRVFGSRPDKTDDGSTIDRVELAHLLKEAADPSEQNANENEIRIFQNAMEFQELVVRDCMVPRIEMDAIEIESPFEELKKLILETRYSRIPVYEGHIDNVVGYVNSKSLLRDPRSIRQVLLPALYVTAGMEVQKALSRFIHSKSSLAIVIDEFGGTAGIVTLEDLLEEIFGEIEDEHDSPEWIEKTVAPGEYVFSGRLEVEYLNEKYGLGIPESDQYDTLAGYIIFHHNGLPKHGDVISIHGLRFRILRANGSKLQLVRLRKAEMSGNE